jgi:hypothetical protein
MSFEPAFQHTLLQRRPRGPSTLPPHARAGAKRPRAAGPLGQQQLECLVYSVVALAQDLAVVGSCSWKCQDSRFRENAQAIFWRDGFCVFAGGFGEIGVLDVVF